MLDIDPKLLERVNAGIHQIRSGKMVILVDDEDRENEGDLCMAAEFVTAESVNFMATHGRGLICLTLTDEQIDRLSLPMMHSPGRGSPRWAPRSPSASKRDTASPPASAPPTAPSPRAWPRAPIAVPTIWSPPATSSP